MTNILFQLLFELNIPHSKKIVKESFENHPSFPSIQAYSDYLFEVGINSMQVKIPYEDLKEVDLPCLARLYTASDSVVIIISFRNNIVSYKDKKNRKREILYYEFTKIWDGELLLIESNEQSKEPDLIQNKNIDLQNKFKKIGSWSGVVLLGVIVSLLFYRKFDFPFYKWLSIVKYLGIIVSILLIHKHIGGVGLVDKICGFNKKVSCNEILNSKFSKIFSWLSMADIGFIYFLGTWLTMLFISSNNIENTLFFLSVMNSGGLILSIPLFYQQSFKIKKWCPLCLMLILILLIEFYFLKGFLSIYSFKLNSFLFVLFGLAISSWLLLLLKTPFKKAVALSHVKKQLNLYSKNSSIIGFLLERSIGVESNSIDNEISIGNKDAKIKLIVVTNPTCQPCKNSHTSIMSLFEQFPLDVKIT